MPGNRPDLLSLSDLARRVRPGDRIGIGGHHFARLPLALIEAVIAESPRNLHVISWGGGLPLEMLLEAGLVGVVDHCFSSLDIFGLAPRFRAAAEAGAIPVRDWTALAMIQGYQAAARNLPSLPFQPPDGSDMLGLVPEIETAELGGRTLALAPALPLDVALIHAPRADRSGNVQIIGARALDVALAGTANRVLVTVEEIVPDGALSGDGRQTVLHRNQISAIAEVPGGAYPASCLPFYVTDYAALRAMLQGDRLQRPDANGSATAYVRRAASVPVSKATKIGAPANEEAAAPTPDERLVIRIAQEFDNHSFASAGAVSPVANIAYHLAKRTHAPDMIIATLTCGHIDIAPTPLTLSLSEPFDCQTAVAHRGGEDTYFEFYQAGMVSHEIVGAAQVDRFGRVNTLRIDRPDGGFIRLPGQGGMADVANLHQTFIIYLPRQTARALVDRVDFVSAARGVIDPAERERLGYRQGPVKLFTNLCVLELSLDTGELQVTELFPGVTRDDVQQNAGFPVRFADTVVTIEEPDTEILRILREEIDPIGLRRLEFAPAREREALLDEVIRADRTITEALFEE
ncbi:MAG: CoA-transferase [Pseudomonadota bacterium]